MEEYMKKILTILFMSSLFLTACSTKNELITADSNQILDILSENQTSYIYVGRPSCPNCQDFKPVLDEVMQEISDKVFYYNTDEMRNEAEYENIIETLDIVGVPTMIKIENGKVTEELIGVQDNESLLQFFE